MIRNIKTLLALAALAFTFGTSAYAQDNMKHEEKAKTLETGSFHGKVHGTSGRATIYQEADGKLVLRLTNFKTSNRRCIMKCLDRGNWFSITRTDSATRREKGENRR